MSAPSSSGTSTSSSSSSCACAPASGGGAVAAAGTSSPSSSASSSPCAACKNLRRKCRPDCVFAPFFPPSDPYKFVLVHKAYGACNVGKMLRELPPHLHHRGHELVDSLVLHARHRLHNPALGFPAFILAALQDIHRLQQLIAASKLELARYITAATQRLPPNMSIPDYPNLINPTAYSPSCTYNCTSFPSTNPSGPSFTLHAADMNSKSDQPLVPPLGYPLGCTPNFTPQDDAQQGQQGLHPTELMVTSPPSLPVDLAAVAGWSGFSAQFVSSLQHSREPAVAGSSSGLSSQFVSSLQHTRESNPYSGDAILSSMPRDSVQSIQQSSSASMTMPQNKEPHHHPSDSVMPHSAVPRHHPRGSTAMRHHKSSVIDHLEASLLFMPHAGGLSQHVSGSSAFMPSPGDSTQSILHPRRTCQHMEGLMENSTESPHNIVGGSSGFMGHVELATNLQPATLSSGIILHGESAMPFVHQLAGESQREGSFLAQPDSETSQIGLSLQLHVSTSPSMLHSPVAHVDYHTPDAFMLDLGGNSELQSSVVLPPNGQFVRHSSQPSTLEFCTGPIASPVVFQNAPQDTGVFRQMSLDESIQLIAGQAFSGESASSSDASTDKFEMLTRSQESAPDKDSMLPMNPGIDTHIIT